MALTQSPDTRNRLAEILMLSTAPGRFGGLEGLRGLAVTLVFFVHLDLVTAPLVPRGSLTETLATGFHYAGSSGVDIFYVLSGYLIYGGLIRRAQDFRPYMARRVQRIYPTFLFILAIYSVLSIAFPSESKLGPNPLAWPFVIAVNALLIPGVVPVDRMITVAGTLSFEMFFYLTIPWIIAKFGLRDRSDDDRLGFWKRAGVLSALILLPINTPHQRMLMFLAGILLWEFLDLRRRQNRPLNPSVLGFTAVAGLFFALGVSFFIDLGEYIGVPRTIALFVALPPLVAATITDGQIVHRVANWTPLRALGNISYSYYLTHGLVLKVLEKVVDTWMADVEPRSGYYWAMIVPCFALTLVGSFVVFVFVERPYSIDRRPLPFFDGIVARLARQGTSP